MKNQIHILNGDSLKEQFQNEIAGDTIIARECLVDGDVEGETLDELYTTRAKFLSQNYGGTESDYYAKAVAEFNKIQGIDSGSDINLWFEDDLFCQVNFWFVASLLQKASKHDGVFLVRPTTHTPYGFAGLSQRELVSIFDNRTPITQLSEIAALWDAHQSEDLEKLVGLAKELKEEYPFILPAVEAHLERIPSSESLGRPTESLISIMKELNTDEFGPVFREFNLRESIYGFGDLQVKRLFDAIKSEG